MQFVCVMRKCGCGYETRGMSSRIIVKNLPKNATKEQLEEHFSKFGQVCKEVR